MAATDKPGKGWGQLYVCILIDVFSMRITKYLQQKANYHSTLCLYKCGPMTNMHVLLALHPA